MSRDYSSLVGSSFSDATSVRSNGYHTLDDSSSQMSSTSGLSAKSIYQRRKEYAASMNRMLAKLQYRMEHLFTCELDGKELRGPADCLERLKLLDGMGRVWGQDMLLEVQGGNLRMRDTETKEELESIAVSDVLEVKAMLKVATFSSLLLLSARGGPGGTTSVFMFNCEDLRADHVQKGLSQSLSVAREGREVRNAGPVTPNQKMDNLYETLEPAVDPPPTWTELDEEEEEEVEEVEEKMEVQEPKPDGLDGEEEIHVTENPMFSPSIYTQEDRSRDILNHLLSDVEIFKGQLLAVVAKTSKKKKKPKKGKAAESILPAEEFAECFHKIKMAFNCLGELHEKMACSEHLHSLFSSLTLLVSHCPEGLPATIVAPLLTPQTICYMSEEASVEEDQLWQTLGDAWNIPSTKWPEEDEDVPVYTPRFFDGWQPPEVDETPSVPAMRTAAKPPVGARSGGVIVARDFLSRNQRELSIRKGERVELLDTSKLWWKVRNGRGEEGYVPSNYLTHGKEQPEERRSGGPVELNRKSKPAEVKAWLQHMGFGKITVRCLGGLSGPTLLGMSREELKMVCPEEGGRVFFQLRLVKSRMDDAH